MIAISVNGIDRIGKTQQASLLGKDSRVSLTGKLLRYSQRWPDLPPTYAFNWWFRDVPFEDFVSIILESLEARTAASVGGDIVVHDRGQKMFRAVCAATLFVRENGSISEDEAIERVNQLFDASIKEKDDIELYFVPDNGYQENMSRLRSVIEHTESAYLPWQNQLYAEYQRALRRMAERYLSNGEGNVIRVVVDDSIVDVQNRVRRELHQATGLKFEPLCDGLDLLLAFGGLSESGKSGFAGQLSAKHRFYRFKIKYFDASVRKQGLQSHHGTIGREILDFLHDHRHVDRASIESLHGDILPAYLKMLFGERFKTVYLDTPEETRIARTVAASNLSVEEVTRRVREKDAVKVAGGGAKVKDIADIVHRNDKPFEDSFGDFLRLIDVSD